MAITLCRYCSWSWSYSGDDPLEEAHLLRGLLIEHVERLHPDKPHDTVEHVVIEDDEENPGG